VNDFDRVIMDIYLEGQKKATHTSVSIDSLHTKIQIKIISEQNITFMWFNRNIMKLVSPNNRNFHLYKQYDS